MLNAKPILFILGVALGMVILLIAGSCGLAHADGKAWQYWCFVDTVGPSSNAPQVIGWVVPYVGGTGTGDANGPNTEHNRAWLPSVRFSTGSNLRPGAFRGEYLQAIMTSAVGTVPTVADTLKLIFRSTAHGSDTTAFAVLMPGKASGTQTVAATFEFPGISFDSVLVETWGQLKNRWTLGIGGSRGQ